MPLDQSLAITSLAPSGGPGTLLLGYGDPAAAAAASTFPKRYLQFRILLVYFNPSTIPPGSESGKTRSSPAAPSTS